MNNNNELIAFGLDVFNDINLSTIPKLTQDQAIYSACSNISKPISNIVVKSELKILANPKYRSYSYHLVYQVSFSTMISWYYYGDKGWKYLFGSSSIKIYQILFLSAIVLGSVTSLGNVMEFSDLMILSCAFPNIIGCLFLLPTLKEKLNEYWGKYNNGEFKVYK